MDSDIGEILDKNVQEQSVLKTKMRDRSIIDWSGPTRGSLRKSYGRWSYK